MSKLTLLAGDSGHRFYRKDLRDADIDLKGTAA
jgi:hypothetical protein